MSGPFVGPDVQHGDVVAVQLSDGSLRPGTFDGHSMSVQVGPKSPKWLRDMIELVEKFALDTTDIAPSSATVFTEIDALKAENTALREELDALLQTEVGEVVAHNQELWAEVIELRAQLRRQP